MARTLPKGARRIRVNLVSVHFETLYNDGYFDNISLSLHRRARPSGM
jgi:hypothetical protein